MEQRTGRLILWTILVIFLGWMIFAAFQVTLGNVTDDMRYGKNNKTSMLRQCDREYYDRQYGDLYEYLRLYDLDDMDTYGVYWEICEGYESYIDYKYCAEEDKDEMRARLQELADNVQYSENQSQFTKWLQ